MLWAVCDLEIPLYLAPTTSVSIFNFALLFFLVLLLSRCPLARCPRNPFPSRVVVWVRTVRRAWQAPRAGVWPALRARGPVEKKFEERTRPNNNENTTKRDEEVRGYKGTFPILFLFFGGSIFLLNSNSYCILHQSLDKSRVSLDR